MAKSRLLTEKEMHEQELKQISDALAEKDLHKVPSAEDADLYKPSLNEEQAVVSTPGHATRAFRQ
jgi:hypothetical protein